MSTASPSPRCASARRISSPFAAPSPRVTAGRTRTAAEASDTSAAGAVLVSPSLSEGEAIAAAAEPRQEGKGPSEPVLRGLLAEHRGNVAAVARLVGKDRVQVHRWMRRYGIDVNEYRSDKG